VPPHLSEQTGDHGVHLADGCGPFGDEISRPLSRSASVGEIVCDCGSPSRVGLHTGDREMQSDWGKRRPGKVPAGSR
jgi:hypothetical protein